MRISDREKRILVGAVLAQDPAARVWLFGSRVDDGKRGGDIDIAVLSTMIGRLERMRIRRAVVDALGEQKVDVVVSADGADPFFRLVVQKGVRIDG
jgi:predicted nucleotidyltransferase